MLGVGKKSRTIRRNRSSQFPVTSNAVIYLQPARPVRVEALPEPLESGLSNGMFGYTRHPAHCTQQIIKRNPCFLQVSG